MAITIIFSLFYTLCTTILQGGEKAVLVFAGDAMQHQSQLDAAARGNGAYDYSECFASIAPYVKSADYAVVNLETTLGGKRFSGYPCFCTPDTFADALKAAGFDLFLTANNHTLDRLDHGLTRTIDVLDRKGIAHLGTYANAARRKAALPFIKEINGIKVGFLNYTYGTNGIKARGECVVDYIDKDLIAADIKDARAGGAELVCVAIHWGDEYVLLPNRSQRQMADFLLSQGVDMVIGGHPHVIQPMEIRCDSAGRKQLLVYSLGNFISGMKKTDTRGGALAEVHISRDASGKAVVDSASYSLVFTVPGLSGKSNYRLVFTDSCDSKEWQPHCDSFARNAEKIFDAHNIGIRNKRKQ